MRFTKVGDLDVVTRITGPTHHLLGMALTDAPFAGSPILERVSFACPEAEVESFDPGRDLCREVLEGIRDANDRLGTHFGVMKVRYCADDPPIPGVYHRLAQALIEHVVSELGRGASLPPTLAPTDGFPDPITPERV
jgi:hypothetical protein